MTDSFHSRQVEKKTRPFSPTLPDSFVPRPDQLKPLKSLLTAPSDNNVLVITSKDGLGGMGKTSLALALTQDEVVKATFPDGILWATLGPEPDLLTPMGQWLLVLDDQGLSMATITMASAQLRHLIKRRRMLLVVDEVWSLEDLHPFQIVQDTPCRLLVTTRDVVVPEAQTFVLGEMTVSQSQQLFETELKQSLEHRNRKDALQFAKSVGYLPLSLTLGVSQIKAGLGWSELIEGVLPLDQSSIPPGGSEEGGSGARPKLGRPLAGLQNLWKPGKAKALQHQARQACLTFCLRRLSSEHRLKLASLALFPRNIEITPKMAGTIWGLSISESRQCLQDLKLRGFLSHGNVDAEQGQSYGLHPVMRDIARWLIQLPQDSEMQGLGLSWPSAHQQFLERYRLQFPAGPWHQIPVDGYIHSHLIWHLDQAGWFGEIHQLLQEFNESGRHAWYDICAHIGLRSNFIVDIARAWQLAKNVYEEAPEHSTGLQIRYALTSAFVRDAQSDSPSEASSLRSEDWAFTKILLNAARYLTDLGPKVINSTLFPSTLNASLKEQSIFELLDNIHQESPEMALELTENLLPNPASIDALIRLVPDRPSFSLPLWQLLQHSSDDKRLVNGVACLAQSGAHQLHPDLFPLLSKMNHPLDRLLILEQIEERLPDLLKKKAKPFKQDCLNDLAARRQGLGQLPLNYGNIVAPLDRATENFLDLYDWSGWAIALCFEQYPSRRLDEAYSQVMRGKSEEKRSKALAFLIPRLSDQHRREIWSFTTQLIDPECKARMLSCILPFRAEALDPLLDISKLFEHQKKLDVLIDCLPGPSELMQSILSTIMVLSESRDRWPIILKILPYLSPDQYPELEMIIQDSPFDLKGSCDLLNALSPEQSSLAAGILTRVEAIPPVYERATALSQIVPYLPQKLKVDALEIALQIQFPYARVIALQNFIPENHEVAQDAMASLKNCHAESPDDVYDSLIPLLPPTESQEAIALIATIPDEASRIQRLIRMLPYQPGLIEDIKALVIHNPGLRDTCELKDVLNELHRICDTDLSSSNPLKPRTLELILSMLPLIDWVYSPHTVAGDGMGFCELVQIFLKRTEPLFLHATVVSSLLDFFYFIPYEEKRAETLEIILQTATDIETITPERWMDWLEKLSRYQPHEFHWVLSSMLRFLMRFSDNNTLNQSLQSIRSVREQWL